MASVEKTAYPVFARSYDDKQLLSDFAVTSDEKKWIEKTARQASARLGLGLVLKSFQYLRYFPEPEEIPPELYDHLRSALHYGQRVKPDFGNANSQVKKRKAILTFVGVRSFNGTDAVGMAAKLASEAAEVKDFPTDIINYVIEGLVANDFELPAFSTIERAADRAHNQIESRVVKEILARTPPELVKKVDALLEVHIERYESDFNKIKKSAGRATTKHLEQLVAHLDWLESFGSFDEIFKGVVDPKIRYFGSIAKQYDAAALKDYELSKRRVCVLSLIHLMQIRTRDQLGEMYLKRIATIQKQAKDELLEIQAGQRGKVEEIVITLGGMLEIVSKEPDNTQLGKRIRDYVEKGKNVERLLSDVEQIKAYSGTNYFPLLGRHFKNQRPLLFKMLKLLELETTCQDEALMAAIEVIKANQGSKQAWITDPVDLSFLTPRWKEFVAADTGDDNGIDRRLFEVCVFVHVAQSLRSGDLAIANSDEFSDYRKELLPWEECKKLIPAHCEKIGIPSSAKELVKWLKKELDQEATKLDDSIPNNSDDVILDDDGRPMVRRGEARPIPASAIRLRNDIVQRLPKRHVIQCLENAEHWLNFTRHFGPISGNEARIKDAAARYLMTIFAYGCNLGPAQAARHLKGSKVSAHMLGVVNRRHMSLEMLENAQRELNEVYLKLDLPKMWGDGKTVAADGTQYNFYDDNLLTGHHFRYRKTGAVAYRHVADNYIAVFRTFIGPGLYEAIYVIEALMNAKLSVEPDVVHSDTQGQTASVFTYTWLYGVKLMPRIRNWKDLRLVRKSQSTKYKHIDGLFSAIVDWELIEKGWQEVMQVAMSIVTGRISSARLLRKLSSYSRRNKLYFAAQELGEVLRTIYLIKWIGSRELRQDVTANTNKMESYNGFSKWVGFGGDVIPVNDPDEQQKRLRYIDLVTSAIILQNAVDMTRVIEQIRKKRPVSDEDLNFLSPYIGEHIRRFGDYHVRLKRPLEPWISDKTFQAAANATPQKKRKRRS